MSEKDIDSHDSYSSRRTFGEKVADKVAETVGSWRFILIQSFLIIIWISLNVYFLTKDKWDPYPFILLNLALSFQAAYTAPIIMMSQNRMEKKDRLRAIKDLNTDKEAKKEIEEMQVQLNQIEEKIDKLIKNL